MTSATRRRRRRRISRCRARPAVAQVQGDVAGEADAARGGVLHLHAHPIAALVGGREPVGERPPRPRDQRLGGVRRHVERVADLLQRAAFQSAQPQRGPLALGQLGERRDHAAELDRADHARLRLLRGGGGHVGVQRERLALAARHVERPPPGERPLVARAASRRSSSRSLLIQETDAGRRGRCRRF
jgi:hypothetical protein